MFFSVDDETLIMVAGRFGGEDALKIVEILKEVDEITDIEIASKTEVELNSVRRILYKLYDHSIVGLRRVRDEDTGWFVFHWRLQPDQIEGFILNQKRRILDKLESRLEYEKSHDFFYCNTPGCKKVPFEDAVDLVFQCPTCNKSLMHFNKDDLVEALTNKIEQIRKELSE